MRFSNGLLFVLISFFANSTVLAARVSEGMNLTSRKAKAHIKIIKTGDYSRICETPPVMSPPSKVLCEGDIDVIIRSFTTLVPGNVEHRPDNTLACSDVLLNELFGFNAEALIYYDEDDQGRLVKSFYGRMLLGLASHRIQEAIAPSGSAGIPAKTGFSTLNVDTSQVSFDISNGSAFGTSGCDGGWPITKDPLAGYRILFDIEDPLK